MSQVQQQKISKTGKMAVYADAYGFTNAIDLHKEIRAKNVVVSSNKRTQVTANLGAENFQSVEFGAWLPFCAPAYNISPRVEDYVLVPVIAMPSDLPNRNGVGFPLKELARWNSEDGMQAYRTFGGKPVHIEHDNEDPGKGVGVIVDTSLRPMIGYGGGLLWKLMLLLAIDRSKDPEYCNGVLTGAINSYSMGAWVESYSCGYCDAPMGVSIMNGGCTHLHPRKPRDFYVLNEKLVYRKVHGVKGFECSIVKDPAYMTAISDKLMLLS